MEPEQYNNAQGPSRFFFVRLETWTLTTAILFGLLYSSAQLPLTWDEGDAFFRAINVARWSQAVVLGPKSLNAELESNARGASYAPNSPNDPNYVPDPVEEYDRAARGYFSSFPSRASLFSKEALTSGFPHVVCREGHPSGYSIALAIGSSFYSAFPSLLYEKQGFRLVGVLLFSLALGVVYRRVALAFGRPAGFAAAIFVLCCPRVFAHAQIAGGDSLLISSWLLAWAWFNDALESKRGAVLWGLALGISFSAKFSGFLLVPPFLCVLLYELFACSAPREFKRDLIRRFGLGVTVGFATFFLLNPPLWNEPVSGLFKFWELNTRRDGFNIPICFFGSLYSLTRPLPWWNGFFWIGVTIPAPILLAALWGLIRGYKSENDFAPLGPSAYNNRSRMRLTALALGLTLPLTRCIPGVPVHDGARLLIASCPFWGVLAGIAFSSLSHRYTPLAFRTDEAKNDNNGALPKRSARRENFIPRSPEEARREEFIANRAEYLARRKFRRRRAITCVCWMAALCAGMVDLCKSAPTYLSFYNAAIGGVSGAYRRGMEPTYYWDSFDDSAIKFLEKEALRVKIERKEREALELKLKAAEKEKEEPTRKPKPFKMKAPKLTNVSPMKAAAINSVLSGILKDDIEIDENDLGDDAENVESNELAGADKVDPSLEKEKRDLGTGVLFSAFSSQTLAFYQHWHTPNCGKLSPISAVDSFDALDDYAFYVLQNRPSGFTPLDFALKNNAEPIGRKYVSSPIDLNFHKRNSGVVLLEIYDVEDVKNVLKAMDQSFLPQVPKNDE